MFKKLIKSDLFFLLRLAFRDALLCHLLMLLFTAKALGQNRDTTYIYYKLSSTDNRFYKVSTVDSADFIRVWYPSDSTKNIIPVTQFYNDGKINFIGTYDLSIYNRSQIATLTGDYISFYPNGKKQSYLHYTAGFKDGLAYFFYPNGKAYCSKKYSTELPDGKDWECYDGDGTLICENGNGRWITYDETFKPVLEGPVKDGLPDGEWHGKTFEADSIKYTYIFKKGRAISGTGYDKLGNQHAFKNFIDESSIKSNPFSFIRKLRANFKIPDNLHVRKSSLDTAFVSFILEKDGRFTDPQIIGSNDMALRQVLQNALNKCIEEQPKRYYGVPLRTKITIAFKDISETSVSTSSLMIPPTGMRFGTSPYGSDEPRYVNRTYRSSFRHISIKEEILGFD